MNQENLSAFEKAENKFNIGYFLVIIFFARLIFGMISEFWFPDELQIYLLGLKFYTTGTWPFFGPDVVYTNSQIPGALQAMLVGLPFYVLPIPEAPYILLNLLSLASLAFLAWYINKRIPGLPQWFLYAWVFTAPWTLGFGTHIVNPSYVLPGAIVFFIGFFETVPSLRKGVLSENLSFFLMGISLLWILQLHMSFVILIPFIMAAFILNVKKGIRFIFIQGFYFFLGIVLLGSLLLPTFIKYGIGGTGGTQNNIVLNLKNMLDFFTILSRYFSFACFEFTRWIGPDTPTRVGFLLKYFWVIPFAIIAGISGVLQPIYMLFCMFKKKQFTEWNSIRIVVLAMFILLYLSFCFSIKGPSSHTFYLCFPLVMIYSFYCWQSLLLNIKWRKFALLFIISGIMFHTAIAIDNYKYKSLYKNRDQVVSALKNKDYKILGKRRSDEWGCCY